MSDLVEWEKARGSRVRSREVATIEKLPPGFQEALEALDRRVRALEERPEPLVPSNSNEQVVIPKGVTDLHERVSNLESGGSVNQSDIDTLAEIIGSIGDAALTHAGVLSKRIDALEARVSNLPLDLLTEVGRAQAELRDRHA